MTENRLRRVAERRGYRLMKSRRRDPLAVNYGGYMLVSVQSNGVVLGGGNVPYSATLTDVEEFFGE